jgi:integrating conjugative element protein (TIGR03749 family)
MASFHMTPPHEHVVWQQAPIDVTLPVGKERMVSFPSAVAFGYDKNILPDNLLRAQNNNGVLYLFAKAPFAAQRVQVKLMDSGQIILLNLSAQKEASVTPIDVVMSSAVNRVSAVPKNSPSTNIPEEDSTPQSNDFSDNAISYISLTRFAAQQLYAPKRLLTQPPAIFRTPMHTAKTVPLFRDGGVIAMPLASWRGGDLTVTAVLLRNQLHQSLTLDPRNICGSWQATTFFLQTVLAVSGQRRDSTTVFLVANRAFADALQTCTRGF